MIKVINIAGICLILTSTIASAKAKREGFNFGVKASAIEGMNLDLKEEKTRSETALDSTSITPYAGYVATDWLNLGLSSTFESQSSSLRLSADDGGATNVSYRESKVLGVSLFGRFLFARILYFEGGIGLYRRSLNIKSENSQSDADGTFQGQKQELASSGAGPGYHLAGGLEFPMAYGFYFTTAYTSRTYQLRGLDGTSDIALGRKTGRESKRDVSFGIAYYYQE